MEYIIFFTKDGDEYLVRFPSSFAFDGYELSVPAGEETPESVHDYLREQIQNTIEISCEGQKAWSLIQKQWILDQQRILAFNNMLRNPALNELL